MGEKVRGITRVYTRVDRLCSAIEAFPGHGAGHTSRCMSSFKPKMRVAQRNKTDNQYHTKQKKTK
eukprot:6255800-Amphidinium_carterae.1